MVVVYGRELIVLQPKCKFKRCRQPPHGLLVGLQDLLRHADLMDWISHED